METYLDRCYDALFNNVAAPECYIRLDRSYIVKAIKRSDCLKHEDKRRKWLYQRLFGYLITVDNIQIAEKIKREIFIILNNKYENDAYGANAKSL